MAKAKKKNDSRAVRERNRKIWKAGDIDSWFEFIKTNDPKSSREWKPKGGDAIMGCCINPEHEDRTPSMSVSFKKGFVKCYGCQYYESDPVRFASLLMGKHLILDTRRECHHRFRSPSDHPESWL